MRFAIDINFKGRPPFLVPVTFRSEIINFLKELIKSSDCDLKKYHEYWGNVNGHRAKPYTFFLNIPNPEFVQTIRGGFYKFDNCSVKLYISSCDPEFFPLIYNGYLKMRDRFILFNYAVELKELYLSKLKSINSEYEKFKILSPVIVRDIAVINENRKNFKGYLSYDNPYYNKALGYSIITLCRRFLNIKNKNINYDIEIDTTECHSVRLHHYSEVMPGTKGFIGIKADKDILELIYDIGLGARRSQGFGMVDVISKNYRKQIANSKEIMANI